MQTPGIDDALFTGTPTYKPAHAIAEAAALPAKVCHASFSPAGDVGAMGQGRGTMRPGKLAPKEALPNRNVFLFLPNIVGYIRVLLLLLSVVLAAKGFHLLFSILYLTSQLLDAIDGELARRFNQVSVFGACFDQVIDRLSTCVLYILNAAAYPRAASVIAAVLLMDVGGHWLLYVSSTAAGASSHKQLEVTASPVLRLYYTSRPLMATAIVGYEAFFVLLLMLQHHLSIPGSLLPRGPPLITAGAIMFWLAVPPMVFKVVTNVLQGLHGAKRLAAMPTEVKTA